MPVILQLSPNAPGPQGDDGEGVPTGGTDGQVLTKTSAVDFATAWETPGSVDTNVFISDTAPVTALTSYLWIETAASEVVTMWVEVP